MTKDILKISLLASTLLVPANAVFAQDDTKKGSAAKLLEEIVIRGTKRNNAEALQSVPSQVAAYGTAQLEARQVVTLEDLTMSTPNVALDGIGTAPGVANFSIRGQGLNSSIPSIDPTVGVFIDGVYIGMSHGVLTDMFDMESVEIHKGPQGVLFGRNVTGGAVLLRSARPDGSSAISARFGAETGLEKSIAFSGQTALSEKLAAKISLQYTDDDGYFDNPTVGRKVGVNESLVIRSTFVLDATDNLSITGIWEHGNMEGDSAISQASAGENPLNPSEEILTVSENPGMSDVEWDQLTFEARYEFDEGSVTNIFGYRKVDALAFTDVDSTPLSLFDAGITSNQHQYSNEIRLNRNMSEDWELVTGLYFYDAMLTYEESRSLVFGSTRIGGGGVQDHQTFGAYANNFYKVTDGVTIQAGLRYSEETKDVTIHPLGSCTYEQVCGAGNDAADKWTNWTPKFGVSWQQSEDVMLYAHWARSYRAGGYNFRSPLSNPVAFGPERVDSFEGGMKATFLDGKLRVNSAVFYNKLDNMQREVNLSDPVIGVFQDISNTASADVKGAELDVIFLVNDNFAINVGLGYLDGDYTDILVDLSGDGIINDSDLALNIPRLSKGTANVGFTYDVNLDSGDLITLRGDWAYRSPAAFTDRNHGNFNAYNMFNAGISFAPESANWGLSIYGKNLGNEVLLGGVTVLPFAAYGGSYFAPMREGRRWGAELTFSF